MIPPPRRLTFLALLPLLLAAAPTTAPSSSFTIGLPADGQSTFITGPAPAVLHVNSLSLCSNPTDWLTTAESWDFGDPAHAMITDPTTAAAIDLNTALTGPVAAHLYETPGNYTVKLIRTPAGGLPQTCTMNITVPPANRRAYYISPAGNDQNSGTDTAHPLATVTAVLPHLADHTAVYFQRGGIYSVTAEIPLKHQDMLIDSYGDTAQLLPVLRRCLPGVTTAPSDVTMIFTTWQGQARDVMIRNLRFDSPSTPATTSGGYVYKQAAATFGILRGTNIAVVNCELACLLEGPHGDPAACGLFFLGNHQVDPLAIESRTLWLEGSDVVAIGNVASNSVNEAPLRAAASGVNRGLVAFNDIAQQLDPAHDRATAKPAITLRALTDMLVYHNRVTNAELTFDPRTETAWDIRFRVQGNEIVNSQMDLKPNLVDSVFTGNIIHRSQGPCITISAAGTARQYIANMQLDHNQGDGSAANGRLIQLNPHTDTQLQNYSADGTNVYVKD